MVSKISDAVRVVDNNTSRDMVNDSTSVEDVSFRSCAPSTFCMLCGDKSAGHLRQHVPNWFSRGMVT